MERDLTKLWQE